jgi:hypothetical protein
MSTRTPPFWAPSRFASGTKQSSNTSSQVPEPRMPSLSSFCAVLKPCVPRSRMKVLMPRGPAAASVLA